MTTIKPCLSIVIPVYQAEKCLMELYRRLKDSLEKITTNFEIIFIEDCSTDNSWETIESITKLDRRVKGFQFSRNFGQHCGITAGLDICDGDWTVIMDCDLQDQPEEIPRLYAKAQEGYDVVIALRKNRKDESTKKLSSWFFYKIFRFLTDMDYDGASGNFRIISRNVVENFRSMNEQLRFFGGLIQWMGFPTTGIDVEHAERFEGKSSYTYLKLLQLSLDAIIAYSDKPLRLAVRGGFLLSTFSFIYGSYIFVRALIYDISIIGWSSLMVSIYFIGGIIITVLGILGIYLGKVFDETKKRPLYIVRRKTSPEDA